MTVLEHIITSLRAAAAYNQHDSAPPSVILWTDSQRLWEPVAGRIGECLERFYILNPEEAGQITGPSTWIRYRLTADAHKEGIPVIYLPGVSRKDLRAPEPAFRVRLFVRQQVSRKERGTSTRFNSSGSSGRSSTQRTGHQPHC